MKRYDIYDFLIWFECAGSGDGGWGASGGLDVLCAKGWHMEDLRVVVVDPRHYDDMMIMCKFVLVD